MKSFTLDGKRHRLHPKVPTGQIRFLVDRQHVGDPDCDITKLIEDRSTSWPDAVRKSAINYALLCHRKNQQLVTQWRL